MRNMTRFPDLPSIMFNLPIDPRGFPVPWFVAWEDGKPLFPVADGAKMERAVSESRCWVCGHHLGRIRAFVIGPMCAVNRVSSEPPSHLECARFSARNCPFLVKPTMKRATDSRAYQERNLCDPAGTMISRNPGVTLVWWTLRHGIKYRGPDGVLFDIGKPHAVEFYREGRAATRQEIIDSIESGLPALESLARQDGPAAQAMLYEMHRQAMDLLPVA